MTAPLSIAIFHNILWSKYKGGVFSALYKLCVDQGVDVQFTQIAETEGERMSLGGVDMSYHRYPHTLLFKGAYSAVPAWRRTWTLARAAMNVQADVVVLPGYERVEYWAMLAVLVLRRKTRAVFCDSTAFDRPPNLLKSIAKRIFFGGCNGFFGYGERSKAYLVSHGADPTHVYFRCQAAALPHDYDPESAVVAREACQEHATPDAPSFVYVGRLAPEKGLFTLLAAFQELLSSYPKARLKLIGAGPLKDDLQTEITRLGLGNNAVMPGSMSIAQLAQEYATATALVLPSTSEPWGLVVNEALSYGCPVVVSDNCGCVPELVIDGVTGYQFPTGDTKALTHCLASVTSAKSLSAWARDCVDHMRNFTPERAAEQILHGSRQLKSARPL